MAVLLSTSHRQERSTHRAAGTGDPEGGFPSAPAALRDAYDDRHHRASRAWPANPGSRR